MAPLGGPNTAQAHPHQLPYSKVVSTAQACAPCQPGCLAPHPSGRSSTLPFLKPVLSSTRPLTDPPTPLCIPIPNTGGPCRACHIVTLESVLMSVPQYCSCQQGCVWSPQDQGLHRGSTLHHITGWTDRWPDKGRSGETRSVAPMLRAASHARHGTCSVVLCGPHCSPHRRRA